MVPIQKALWKYSAGSNIFWELGYQDTPLFPGLARRGGGAAIAVRMDKFHISKLNIPAQSSWSSMGFTKTKSCHGKISTIIVRCFNYPPRSKKNRDLIDHLTSQSHYSLCWANFWWPEQYWNYFSSLNWPLLASDSSGGRERSKHFRRNCLKSCPLL